MALPAWVYGPFELLVHAELHYRAGQDFDRRIALISFDNAIEVAISTYLSLHPLQRKGVEYDGKLVASWLVSFPSKLRFISEECKRKGVIELIDNGHLMYYHNIRNEQYHEGKATVPALETLNEIRRAAIWVFSFLCDVTDTEEKIEERVVVMAPDLPLRDDESDALLDDEHGVMWFGETRIYTSDLLYSFDPIAYRDRALEIKSQRVLKDSENI